MKNCRENIINSGAALIPRSCTICGLGPCTDKAASEQEALINLIKSLGDRLTALEGRLNRMAAKYEPIGVPIKPSLPTTWPKLPEKYSMSQSMDYNISLGDCDTCAGSNCGTCEDVGPTYPRTKWSLK